MTTTVPTRSDIAALLASIGKPGEKQEEKISAVKELNINNSDGVGIEETLPSYLEY